MRRRTLRVSGTPLPSARHSHNSFMLAMDPGRSTDTGSTTGFYMRARPLVWGSDELSLAPHAPKSFHRPFQAVEAHDDLRLEDLSHRPSIEQRPPWRRLSITHAAFPPSPNIALHVATPEQGYLTMARRHNPTSLPHYSNIPENSTQPDASPTRSTRSFSRSLSQMSPFVRMDPPPPYVPRDTPDSPPYTMPGGYPPSPTTCSANHMTQSSPYPPSPARCATLQREAHLSPSDVHPSSCCCSLSRSATCTFVPECSPPSPCRPLTISCEHDDAVTVRITPHAQLSSCSRWLTSSRHPACHGRSPSTAHCPHTSRWGSNVMQVAILLRPDSHCGCPNRQDMPKRKSPFSCSYILPFALLLPFMLFMMWIVPSRPPSSHAPPSHTLTSPLFWRALSSLLSYVFRMLRDVDTKM